MPTKGSKREAERIWVQTVPESRLSQRKDIGMSGGTIRRRVVVSGVAAVALAFMGLTSASGATAAASRTAIADTLPSWATPSAGVAAPAVTNGTLSARIYLAGQNPAGLTAYATAVSTPGSALYRHYLTPAEVQTLYGPTTSQIAAIESWVRSAGLTVTSVNGQTAGYVAVSGSLAQAGKAFAVSFGMFKGPDGHFYRAPEEAASAPSSIARSILTISGLNSAPDMAKPEQQLPPPGPNYWIGQPCSQYYGQKIATTEPEAYGKSAPWTNCGYTQAQIRSAYGVTASGMTGKGQTVAIVDAYASPTMPADADQFATVTGDKPFASGQFQQYLPTTFTLAGADECDAPGWYGEETLDIEAVHGQAPGARVRFVAAASCTDPDLAQALALIVNEHLASIVSSSWGEPADDSQITP
jgi:subtilase family serine protease